MKAGSFLDPIYTQHPNCHDARIPTLSKWGFFYFKKNFRISNLRVTLPHVK